MLRRFSVIARYRLAAALILLATAFSIAAAFVARGVVLTWFERDLELRSSLAAQAIGGRVIEALQQDREADIPAILNELIQDQRVRAVALCMSEAEPLVRTALAPSEFECDITGSEENPTDSILNFKSSGALHVASRGLFGMNVPAALVIFHETEYLRGRMWTVTWYTFSFVFSIVTVIGVLANMLARVTLRGWTTVLQSTVRELAPGRTAQLPSSTTPQKEHPPELRSVMNEFRNLVQEVESDRAIFGAPAASWSPETLQSILSGRLSGEQIIVVSNREPYSHVKKGDEIQVRVPPSGVVTALEPIVRACEGTWVAHGSGDADHLVVDEEARVRVPPEEESYTLRRVWLSQEEEEGYYYGFANEGIWPLCHIAHTRPIFRPGDWAAYRIANERFADSVVAEAKADNPIVLIQDYHFALLPRMLRDRLPRATLILFWHIPWPNPEAFGICPWRKEILDGMLGSTIIGFHTRFHRNNFLDTIDRFIECRIERESSVVTYGGQDTAVRSYPISIEWPPRFLKNVPPIEVCRSLVRERHSLPPDTRVLVGVERLDYTKGILERLSAFEALLEANEDMRGKVCFVQIAAPSRSKLPAYRALSEDVTEMCERINKTYATEECDAIVFLEQHHEPSEVATYYRACDVCLVTSLHDGMNLVAKEFVATRDDEQGVLILSMFTGAARELPEALVVNPYSIEQLSEALRTALRMTAQEQQLRMRNMREQVREFNVYRWAGRMLIDAARIREQRRIEEIVTADDRGVVGLERGF